MATMAVALDRNLFLAYYRGVIEISGMNDCHIALYSELRHRVG